MSEIPLLAAESSAAVAAAAAGVWLYAAAPGVVSYHLNLLLLTPLLTLVLMGAARVLPYRVQWAIAIPLAPLGAAAYLVWSNDQWWNYGALLALPLLALAFERDERKRAESGAPPAVSAWVDGPWGPP